MSSVNSLISGVSFSEMSNKEYAQALFRHIGRLFEFSIRLYDIYVKEVYPRVIGRCVGRAP